MPIIESLSSYINSTPIDSSTSKNDLSLVSAKNTKTNSSVMSESDLAKRKNDLNDIPLSFASFYYSLKVLKGKDEREDVQKKTFAKWINSQLLKIKYPPVRDLFQDLRDGTVLIKLLEILTGKEIKKEIGRMKVHHMGNVNIVLSTLRENKIRLTNINASDIVEGNPKLTLGLVWNIIQHWQVRDVLRTAVFDIQTTNLEKALLTWCQNSTKDYYDVNIKDFTNSWKDGLAFNALIHKHRPHLLDFNKLVEDREKFTSSYKYKEYTLENAFNIAQKKLQIERLLDIEDVITDYPDKKSIMMYVMCYFQVLSKSETEINNLNNQTESIKLATLKSDKATLTQSFSDLLNEHTKIIQLSKQQQNNSNFIISDKAVVNNNSHKNVENTETKIVKDQSIQDIFLKTTNDNTILEDNSSENYQKGMASISVSSSSSSTTTSPMFENYLVELKKVIEWLHSSENSLSNQPEIGHDVNSVKAQFQTHEDFMLDLTKHQSNVGLVLQEGSRIINSGTINIDEDTEIRKQMKLLNDLWENLRLQAVERQAKLHERLMKLQTEQLNQMDIWLSNAENRINNISQLADSFEGLVEQKDELSKLQDDLVKEQEAVDCLKQIIVVVDDNTDDQAFTDLENKLSSLSDRWSNVCKFVGNRWFTVQDLIIKLQSIETDFNDLNTWISSKSVQLNILVDKTKPLVLKNKINAGKNQFVDNQIDIGSAFYEEYSKLEFNSSVLLIKILKEIEVEMQAMHAKLNDMNEIGEQIGTQLNNSPNLSNSINNKMDTLEEKWNYLLEKMEYLSRVCTEQQQIELNQASKTRTVLQPIDEHIPATSRLINQAYNSTINNSAQIAHSVITETDEISEVEVKEDENIDKLVDQLIKFLDGVDRLVLPDDSSLEEHNELIQKANAELEANEPLIEKIHEAAEYLAGCLEKEEKSTDELSNKMEMLTKKWNATQQYLAKLEKAVEQGLLNRKASDELATLKDVHEGYQKYIYGSEELSHDAQKLNFQLETNKVKLKGMNSYETRLNNLKQQTNNLENKDLRTEIENFSLKWSETYQLINKRNEDILNFESNSKTRSSSSDKSTSGFHSEKLATPKKIIDSDTMITSLRSPNSGNFAKKQQNSSSSVTHFTTAKTTKVSSSSSISNKHLFNEPSGAEKNGSDPAGSENSDDDILHVVTNVYTIPIIKSTSAGNGPFILGSTKEINVTTSCNEQFLANDHCQKSSNLLTSSNSVPVVLGEPINYKKTEYSSGQVPTHLAEQGGNKSKFQIRSIVEIYENPIEEQEQDKCTLKNSGYFEETTTKEIITEDDRQNNVGLKELTSKPSESYLESKRVVLEWLNQIENSLTADDCKITFVNILEDRLQTFKDLQNEIREKSSNIDYLQQNAEEIASKSTVELNVQIKSDIKHLKSRYQNIIDSVADRIDRLERLISDLKQFDSEYRRVLNNLNKIEAHAQIEHHGSTSFGLSHGKSIQAELENLKQIKYDLDNLQPDIRKVNESSEKYLYELSPSKQQRVDQKFQNKLKDDLILINEKSLQLANNYNKSLAYLEEAHRKSVKIDNEIDALDHWITMKDHEIPEDEGIIINEEQFEQRIVKYRQMRSEIERRSGEVKRIIDTGNDMLKNSSGGVSNVADLAKCLININNKWSILCQKVDLKNKFFDQMTDYVNELRQLLHEEKNWLERLEKKLNSSVVGGDAEELSEQLDNIETFIKSHSSQSRERIGEVSHLLIEKKILIQLANSDTKEFQFRWQLLLDDAQRKLQSLDSAINDVQSWEKRLLELQEWVTYMDKYLFTRIEQDIFADDVPEDFARIHEEFVQNEFLLKELEDGVERYKAQGKLDAATRLDQQMNIMKKNWAELNHKFKKFQKPADFDQKLNKVQKLLDEIEQALYMIEVTTEDPETIHLQLEHCMKFYKTLSELKGQIELVLKQGRSIVDKKQVDDTVGLTRQLDTLKQKYNDLGSRVTNGKNELEKAFKVAKKFRKEYNVINDFMGKIDGELRKIEQKPLSKNYMDELEWIKNTKSEINKVETINLQTMNTLKRSFDDIVHKSSTPKNLTAHTKIREIEEKVFSIQKRINDRADFLHSEASKLEASFHSFLENSRQVMLTIERLQQQLADSEHSDVFDSIDREVNLLLSDVEMCRVQGTDLCSKSEQYTKTVESELRSMLVSFEEVNRRLNMVQENQDVITKTDTQRSKFEESKYSRRNKSPSESSMDSTVDVFDSELRQKYMRAVAYLRILDEAPIMEHGEEEEFRERSSGNDTVDIEFVIQQAKQVAKLNEHTNPERARRILDKVQKLEQRWSVTKSKKDSLKSAKNIYTNHKTRVENTHDSINIIEEKLTEYKSDGDDWALLVEFQSVLQKIEELFCEEQVINELSFQIIAVEKPSDADINQSLKLYEKWYMVIENSKLEILINYAQKQNSLLKKYTEKFKVNDSGKRETSVDSMKMNQSKIITTTNVSFDEENSDKFYEASTSFDKSDEGNEVVIKKENDKDCKTFDTSQQSTSPLKNLNTDISSGDHTHIAEPSEFIKCLDKLVLSTSTVEKHLEGIQRLNKEFFEFEKQDLKLNAIKQTLESLSMALKTSLLHKNSIIQKSDIETKDKITILVNNLSKQNQECLDKFKEKQQKYAKNNITWKEFHKNYGVINKWLDITLAKLENIKKENDLADERIKEIVNDFSNLTSYRLLLEKTYLSGNVILNKSNEADSRALSAKLNKLNMKWKTMIFEINQLKEKAVKTVEKPIEEKITKSTTDSRESSPFEQLNKKLDEHDHWLAKCDELLIKSNCKGDETKIENLISELYQCENDLPYQKTMFEIDFKKYRPKLINSTECHSADQYYATMMNEYSKLHDKLPEKRLLLQTNIKELNNFQTSLDEMNEWINTLHSNFITKFNKVSLTQESPTETDSELIKSGLNANYAKFEKLTDTYASFIQDLKPDDQLSETATNKMDNLVQKWKELVKMSSTDTNLKDQNPKIESKNIQHVRPSQLNIQSIKVTASNSIELDLKSPKSSISEKTSSPDSPTVVNYQISQSSSKIFTSNKSASSSFTSHVNIILTKEGNSSINEIHEKNVLERQVSTHKDNVEKNDALVSNNQCIQKFEETDELVETAEITENEAENEEILKIIQKHSASAEFDKLLPVDNGIKIVTLTEDKDTTLANAFDSKSLVNECDLSENENFEIIYNNLFDWLLWINHTIESQIVTVGDLEEIQQAILKFDSIFNEINKRQEQLENLNRAAEDKEYKSGVFLDDKIKELNVQWKESSMKVIDKKHQFTTMLDESRKLEEVNNDFLGKIVDMENKIDNLPEQSLGRETLRKQKTEFKRTKSELNQIKVLFDEIKEINQRILTKYQTDNTGKIQLKYDRLVARFDELCNKLFVRGDSITDALQMIDDYDGQLIKFSEWLYKIEQDLNYLEDYCLKSEDTNSTRQTVIELYQELQKEIDSHNDSYSSLSHTSHKILDSFKNSGDKENLQVQLNEINKRWSLLRKKSLEIRSRLESNSTQWSALLSSLKELILWCQSQQSQIVIKKQELQPDLNTVSKQINENNVFMCNIEYKKSIIESSLASAKLYYDDRVKFIELSAEQDETLKASNDTCSRTTTTLSGLKKKLSSKKRKNEKKMKELKIDESSDNSNAKVSVALDYNSNEDEYLDDDDDELNFNCDMPPSEIAKHLVDKIDKKVKLLDRLWQDLNIQAMNYNNKLLNFQSNLQYVQKSFESVSQKLDENEEKLALLNNNSVSEIESDKLAAELERVKNFQLKLSSDQPLIDDMCTRFNEINQDLKDFESKQHAVCSGFNTKFDDLNLRWSNLQNQLQDKYLHMYSLIESSGASIFLKLTDSVQSPWQRGISTSNKVPYYINHATEMTSWDHPKMIDLYKSFTSLNDIRFSAYRTAMKLRTLQKRLWLDFVDISDAIEAFDTHGLKGQNERNLDTVQVIQCLNKLFQSAVKQNHTLIDNVQAVDLTLNWLLSVYDPSRCGQIRVLSLKAAIIVLCKCSIEEKYIYLYSLISDSNGLCSPRKLGLLLYELIMIPKQLGEVAAFGGSNVEPSVRSCFEFAKTTENINLGTFLDWLKLEPQSIVWLPVLHRLAAAETARHDTKCSICKEYPIVGFRYRSLKHFNFDVCQNCFFSGRKIKGFKFDHPLLEYYTPTSSSDDIKDFFKIFRNKFRSKRARRSSKLGYLPVQSVLEGDDIDNSLSTNSPLHTIVNPIDEESQFQHQVKLRQAQIIQEQEQEELKQQLRQELQLKSNLRLQQQQEEQKRKRQKSMSPNRNSVTYKEDIQQTQIYSPDLSIVNNNINGSNSKQVEYAKLNHSLEDEHALIAQLCQNLNSSLVNNEQHLNENGNYPTMEEQILIEQQITPLAGMENPSPIEVLSESGDDQQQELENIINDLEEENMYLMEEYTRLQNQLNTANSNTNTLSGAGKKTINGSSKQFLVDSSQNKNGHGSRAYSTSPTQNLLYHQVGKYNTNGGYKSNTSLNYSKVTSSGYNRVPQLFTALSSNGSVYPNNQHHLNNKQLAKETQIMAEARLLRQHEDRLEARMKILENHNRLLDSQLKQLRNMLNNPNLSQKDISYSKYSTISSSKNISERKTADRTSLLSAMNTSSNNINGNQSSVSNNSIGALFNNVEDITRAINNLNSLVNSMGSVDKNL